MTNTTYTTSPPTTIPEFTDSAGAIDAALGGLLAVCILAGVTGNSLSLLYFWPRKKKTIHAMLYTSICCIDISTCVTVLPILPVLFTAREPLLFNNTAFCGLWSVVFKISVTMSLFLVVVLSVTRTIAITAPFRQIVRRSVLMAITGYAAFLLVFDLVLIGAGLVESKYYRDTGFCSMSPRAKDNYAVKVWDYIFVPFINIETLGPLVAVSISFIFSAAALFRQSKRNENRKERKFRQVSITIAIFTATFIMCNLPTFILKTIGHFIKWFEMEDYIMKTPFFYWHGEIFFRVILNVLNAVLNPLIYLLRMPKYRQWVKVSFKSISMPTISTRMMPTMNLLALNLVLDTNHPAVVKLEDEGENNDEFATSRML